MTDSEAALDTLERLSSSQSSAPKEISSTDVGTRTLRRRDGNETANGLAKEKAEPLDKNHYNVI